MYQSELVLQWYKAYGSSHMRSRRLIYLHTMLRRRRMFSTSWTGVQLLTWPECETDHDWQNSIIATNSSKCGDQQLRKCRRHLQIKMCFRGSSRNAVFGSVQWPSLSVALSAVGECHAPSSAVGPDVGSRREAWLWDGRDVTAGRRRLRNRLLEEVESRTTPDSIPGSPRLRPPPRINGGTDALAGLGRPWWTRKPFGPNCVHRHPKTPLCLLSLAACARFRLSRHARRSTWLSRRSFFIL